MATHQFTSDELRQLHDLAKQWAKIVSRWAVRNDGPGLDVDFRTFAWEAGGGTPPPVCRRM
jgi:hypothetical protein